MVTNSVSSDPLNAYFALAYLTITKKIDSISLHEKSPGDPRPAVVQKHNTSCPHIQSNSKLISDNSGDVFL